VAIEDVEGVEDHGVAAIRAVPCSRGRASVVSGGCHAERQGETQGAFGPGQVKSGANVWLPVCLDTAYAYWDERGAVPKGYRLVRIRLMPEAEELTGSGAIEAVPTLAATL
jgi:hypothetical protein